MRALKSERPLLPKRGYAFSEGAKNRGEPYRVGEAAGRRNCLEAVPEE